MKESAIQMHRDRYMSLRANRDSRSAAFDMVGGGDYEAVGFTEAVLLNKYAPVPTGGFLVDVGCGPGRLARYLIDRADLRYLGTDVIPELLAVARAECNRSDWSFVPVEDHIIPVSTSCVDVVAVFSVLTNIYPEQAFVIMREAFRVLVPGGALLITYFDINNDANRQTFLDYAERQKDRIDPLVFLNGDFIRFFADSIGFERINIVAPELMDLKLPPNSVLKDGRAISAVGFGQTLCILRKPIS